MRLTFRMLLFNQALAIVIGILLYFFVGLQNAKPIFLCSFIFCNCVGFSVHILFSWLGTKDRYVNAPRGGRFLMGAGMVLAGTLLGVTTAFGLLRIVYSSTRFSWNNILPLFAFSLVIAGLVSLGLTLYAKMKESIEHKALENQRLKELQAKTRLMTLQSKVNPHFLFNTLNTMLNLVYKSPREVETIILNLSDIYRRILQLPEDGLISVQEEMDLIRQYLEIEKIRLGDRLTYSITVDPVVASFGIPPMIIEPVIENAVIHGLGPKPEGGRIQVDIRPTNGGVRFTVEDNGAGIAAAQFKQGFGLYSIQERLRLMYRGKERFSLRPLPEGGVQVVMELPDAH